MYTPGFNQVSDRTVLLETMRAFSFAILFGPATEVQNPGKLMATHLPLLVKDDGPHGTLVGHFAKANPHAAELAGRETLVVFPGAHSYVSPSLYVEQLSVPTWNYIAVHAYGVLQAVDDPAGKNGIVEELIQVHEPSYLDRWRAMPAGFVRTMLAGIVGFRIPIARIEGKFKLSQNRSETERQNIYAAQTAGNADERELAQWMARLMPEVHSTL
jgi:transcriptional regulator